MKTQLCIAIMMLLSYQASAQVNRNNSYVAINGAFNYAPPSDNTTVLNGKKELSGGENKAFSGAFALSYGLFLKDNRTFTIGIYANASHSVVNSQNVYDTAQTIRKLKLILVFRRKE